jgi:hypothetical protein
MQALNNYNQSVIVSENNSIQPSSAVVDLDWRGDVVHSLARRINDGHYLQKIPADVIFIIENDLWREYKNKDFKCHARHETFESFVSTRFPQGLGTDLKTLKNLCRDHPKAIDAIDRACKREPGGDQRSEQAKAIIVDNINIESRPDGTSREAGLRRLRKDRPDLHEQVLEGKKSVHAACVEAGFRKKLTALEAAKKAVDRLANADIAERIEFARYVVSRLGLE